MRSPGRTMNLRPSTSPGATRALGAFAASLGLLTAACGGTIVSGDSFENEEGGSSSVGGGANQGGASTSAPAVAMSRARLDVLWDEYWETHGEGDTGSSGSGSGDDLDPNDLFIQLSDMGTSCSSPHVELPCGGHWSVTLGIPPALQAVGVYDLESDALTRYSSMWETGAPNSNSPGDCPAGGGSLFGGTLEILAIDADTVRFRLTMEPTFDGNDPSGEYTAPRCD